MLIKAKQREVFIIYLIINAYIFYKNTFFFLLFFSNFAPSLIYLRGMCKNTYGSINQTDLVNQTKKKLFNEIDHLYKYSKPKTERRF